MISLLLAMSGMAIAAAFDYHSIRGRKPSPKLAGLYEGEDLRMTGTAREQAMGHYDDAWSGGSHLVWHGKIGQSLQTGFRIERAGRYRVEIRLTKAVDYGRFRFSWNGTERLQEIDLYHPRVVLTEPLDLGEMSLPAGDQELTFELTGSHPRAKTFRGEHFLLGLDYVKLEALDAPKENEENQPAIEVAPDAAADPLQAEAVRPILTEYCHRCHGGEQTKGKVDLKSLTTKQAFLDDIELTRKVADALTFHEMPPEDEKPMPPELHRRLTATFQSWVDDHLQNESRLPATVMRRINRYEYNNAVRDLLDLKGDIFALPEKPIRAAKPYFNPASGRYPDRVRVSNRALGKNQIEQHLLTGVTPFAIDLQAEHGFNNRGEQLSLSPILLESFLKLGQAIVFSPEFDSYTKRFDTLFTAPTDLSVEEQTLLARDRIEPLLERAFRQRPREATINRYAGHFTKEMARTGSFTDSMKSVVAAILASPRFIYITEHKRQANAEERLTGYELATRLALFLWSSIPDDELLALARTGELRRPPVLQAQIRRLLEDPRSQALSQSFARQWLRLDQLITAVPDFERFEVYYSRIGCEQWKFGLQTMLEPLLLFESIMVEDRSIMLLVDSNYTYRSEEMQSWYREEIPFKGKKNRGRFDTFVQAFERRPLMTRREGGVITSAATLTMTSSPLRTSPIIRGAWVATVILNRPPPPPPDIVPEIEADDAAIEAQGLTLRDRLEQHQVNPNCVSCHQKIDPLGYALENFDAVGRWRDHYRSGLPIDASGELFGQAKFKDVVGLKDALLENPAWFMRGFTEHLLSYALGRELKTADKPAVDRILRQILADHGQFSTVVLQVATSYPFLHKTNQAQPPDPNPSK